MTTRTVTLSPDAYTLISNKSNFIIRVVGANPGVEIRAQNGLPSPDDIGLPLDPSKALTRAFDGDVYGIAINTTATVVVLETDS